MTFLRVVVVLLAMVATFLAVAEHLPAISAALADPADATLALLVPALLLTGAIIAGTSVNAAWIVILTGLVVQGIALVEDGLVPTSIPTIAFASLAALLAMVIALIRPRSD